MSQSRRARGMKTRSMKARSMKARSMKATATGAAKSAAFAIALGAFGPAASAALTVYTDEAAWRAAAGGAISTIGVPGVPLAGAAAGHWSQSHGISMQGMGGVVLEDWRAEFWGVPTGTVALADHDIMYFASPVTAFALDWWVKPGNYVPVQFSGPQGYLGYINYWGPPTFETRFFGVISTVPITQVDMSVTNTPNLTRNVMFTQIVPAPGALAAFAAALLAPRIPRRRRWKG